MHTRSFALRQMVVPIALMLGLIASNMAWAAYPEKIIKLVIPFAPGAGTDIVTRMIATSLEHELGQKIVLENRSGAGGDIANDFAAKAAPDGYTIVVNSSNLLLAPILRKEAKYGLDDFIPLGRFATAQLIMVASPTRVTAKNINELIDYSKKNPSKLNFGSAGSGAPPDLLSEILRMRTGLNYEAIAYRGMAPALADLLGGNIDFTNPSILAVKQHIDTGKMRGIAVTGMQRLALAPGVPTFAESGIDVAPMSNGTWWGLFAPTGTPENIVITLNQAINRALADPETRKKLEDGGYSAAPLTQQEFASQLKQEIATWRLLAPSFKR